MFTILMDSFSDRLIRVVMILYYPLKLSFIIHDQLKANEVF